MEAVPCDPVDPAHVELVKPDEGFVSLTAQHAQNSASEAPREAEKMAQRDLSDRKRKIDCCDSMVPDLLPLKKRNATLSRENSELKPEHIQCICTEWIPLKDMNDSTFELWTAHLSVCTYANTKGIKSLKEMINSSSDDPALQGLKSFFVATCTPNSPDTISSTLKQSKDSELPHDTADLTPKVKFNAIVPPSYNTTHESLVGSTTPEKSIMCESVPGPLLLPARRRKVRGPSRSEAERFEAFCSDPQVKEVEPYRVLCAICNRWIKLRNNSRYSSIPWNCHKTSCKEEYGVTRAKFIERRKVTKSMSPKATQEPSTRDVIDAECSKDAPTLLDVSSFEMKGDRAVSPPDVNPVSSPDFHPEASSTDEEVSIKRRKEPRRRRVTDAKTRRAALESDPYADSVEPNRLMCDLCKKWVKLRSNSSYCAAPWQTHIQRCVTRAFKFGQEGDWKLKIEKSAFLPPEFMNALTLKLSKTAGVKRTTEETGEDDLQLSDEPQADGEQSDGLCAKASSNKVHRTQKIIKKRSGRPPKHHRERQPSVTPTDISYESEEN